MRAARHLSAKDHAARRTALSPRPQFGSLHVRCEQPRKTLGIAACHAAFGGHAIDPGMALRGGEASSVAGHVVTVHEAEIELGLRAQLQPGKRCEKGVVGTRLRY